jgi:hypothetical protein
LMSVMAALAASPLERDAFPAAARFARLGGSAAGPDARRRRCGRGCNRMLLCGVDKSLDLGLD